MSVGLLLPQNLPPTEINELGLLMGQKMQASVDRIEGRFRSRDQLHENLRAYGARNARNIMFHSKVSANDNSRRKVVVRRRGEEGLESYITNC